jgi:osmoprotectant transport system permease protein
VRDYPKMVAGSLLVALLAIVADLLLAGLQKLLVSPGLRAAPAGPRRLRLVSSPSPANAQNPGAAPAA